MDGYDHATRAIVIRKGTIDNNSKRKEGYSLNGTTYRDVWRFSGLAASKLVIHADADCTPDDLLYLLTRLRVRAIKDE
jgi:hypothetical protein